MDDLIVRIIIAAFHGPLHYLLPVRILFVTGREPEAARKRFVRSALIDSSLSMSAAFAIVIPLVAHGGMLTAMLILWLSMPYLTRIGRNRREKAWPTTTAGD